MAYTKKAKETPQGETEETVIAKETAAPTLKSYAKFKVKPKVDDEDRIVKDENGEWIPVKQSPKPEQVSKIEQWAVDELNSQWKNSNFYYFEV